MGQLGKPVTHIPQSVREPECTSTSTPSGGCWELIPQHIRTLSVQMKHRVGTKNGLRQKEAGISGLELDRFALKLVEEGHLGGANGLMNLDLILMRARLGKHKQIVLILFLVLVFFHSRFS